jgi:phosphohistidine swiveling domain-containing protein
MDRSDPLHNASYPESWWSRTVAAEAAPGVMQPLDWSTFGWSSELAMRAAYHALGALPAGDVRIPGRAEDLFVSVFYGRMSAQVDVMLRMAEAIPGASAREVSEHVLGFVPESYVSNPRRERYPIVLARLPVSFMRVPRMVERACAEAERWYRREIARSSSLDATAARVQFAEALELFRAAHAVQAIAVFAGVQPVYEQMLKLMDSVELEDLDLMSAYGSHAELKIIEDLWALSRNEIDMSSFLASHGFHGPGECEVSAKVWREDEGMLESTLNGYAAMGDERNPLAMAERKRLAREEAERTLLAALPARRRPSARLLLRLAHRRLPMRGTAKVAFLQYLDVVRSASRRLGELLAADGTLEDPADILMLSRDEVSRGPIDGAVIEPRREHFQRHLAVEVPSSWQGTPSAEAAANSDRLPVGEMLSGLGVSPGVAEGTARVVADPAEAEFASGDILVAHTTDPSWASVMFLADALVVDIGGHLSHAAVVAREMGIPCVVGLDDASTRLRTGDTVRVDGRSGTVQLVPQANYAEGGTRIS